MFGKLWLHKMYGRGLAGGALTQAQFSDCVLKNLPVNLMVLLDCHCALICASFLGPLINWMLSGTDRRWKEMTTETGLWTFGPAKCPRKPPVLHICPPCASNTLFFCLVYQIRTPHHCHGFLPKFSVFSETGATACTPSYIFVSQNHVFLIVIEQKLVINIFHVKPVLSLKLHVSSTLTSGEKQKQYFFKASSEKQNQVVHRGLVSSLCKLKWIVEHFGKLIHCHNTYSIMSKSV